MPKAPSHYQHGTIEPIDFILANRMGFFSGCIIKYITRYQYSDTRLEDLEKAQDYLERLIAHVRDGGLE